MVLVWWVWWGCCRAGRVVVWRSGFSPSPLDFHLHHICSGTMYKQMATSIRSFVAQSELAEGEDAPELIPAHISIDRSHLDVHTVPFLHRAIPLDIISLSLLWSGVIFPGGSSTPPSDRFQMQQPGMWTSLMDPLAFLPLMIFVLTTVMRVRISAAVPNEKYCPTPLSRLGGHGGAHVPARRRV